MNAMRYTTFVLSLAIAVTSGFAACADSAAGTTLIDRIANEHRVVVGTKWDQPGMGLKVGRGEPQGFDVDVAKYVINELASSLTTYAIDPATGALRRLQSLPTLPAGFAGENICAEIRLSPDGRFVYGSNRGHDSLAVFARDAAQGTLTLVEVVPSGGRHPRNFNLSPDGHWLVCANRDTDNVTVFRVDPATGRLQATGQEIRVPQAVCVLFALDQG